MTFPGFTQTLSEMTSDNPIRSCGLDCTEEYLLLKSLYPSEPWFHVICGYSGSNIAKILNALVTSLSIHTKTYGFWTLEITTAFPNHPCLVSYKASSDTIKPSHWVGIVRLTRNTGETFLLASWLSSIGTIGERFFTTVASIELFETFLKEVKLHVLPPKDGISVHVWGGYDFELEVITKEEMILDTNIKEDILNQIYMFFENKDLYKKLGVPYRRGFLFVGTPGNGKTMMIRHIIRKCHEKYEAKAWVLNMHRRVDETDLSDLIKEASKTQDNHIPGIIFLEDIDSLTKESMITRSGLLNLLDGIETKDGLLIVATTNNPGDIDPALVHRPSRFDRVWHFELPNLDLRYQYIQRVFPQVKSDFAANLAKKTKGWSFAYLNELRITGASIAIQDSRQDVLEEDIFKAYELLATQFKAGKKSHVKEDKTHKVGFGTAEDSDD